MAILTDIEGQAFRVPGHYALVLGRYDSTRLETVAFPKLTLLARELWFRYRAYRWRSDAFVNWNEIHAAVSPNGKLLDLGDLWMYGQRLRDARAAERHYPGYVHRQGPVYGIHCYRGRKRYFRRISTTPERRQAALVVVEDGEVAPRPARSSNGLPNSWDDYSRSLQRSWKTQHKGRKAWDRVTHGKGDRESA